MYFENCEHHCERLKTSTMHNLRSISGTRERETTALRNCSGKGSTLRCDTINNYHVHIWLHVQLGLGRGRWSISTDFLQGILSVLKCSRSSKFQFERWDDGPIIPGLFCADVHPCIILSLRWNSAFQVQASALQLLESRPSLSTKSNTSASTAFEPPAILTSGCVVFHPLPDGVEPLLANSTLIRI